MARWRRFCWWSTRSRGIGSSELIEVGGGVGRSLGEGGMYAVDNMGIGLRTL